MGKQLVLSENEQKQIANAFMVLSEIMFKKMDEGVSEPCITGENIVNNENKKLVFEITAKRKEDSNA